MSTFVATQTILDKILDHKVEEIARARRVFPMAKIAMAARREPPARDVLTALNQETVSLIAEVKHASPSRGVLIKDFNPLRLARIYEENGAAMISVLTDSKFFRGDLDYLRHIRRAVRVPLLRKDFIIDAYQIYEARYAGADAILLIVAALSDIQLEDLFTLTKELGMTALVEVHNEAELERALRINPKLIGVNNRDLKTFEVDLDTTRRIAERVPDDVTLVAESGLKTAADIQRMGALGANAVLIGEGLVTASDISQQVRLFSSQEVMTT